MGQGMRVTVDAAMRARDVSRIRPEDEIPRPPDDGDAAEPAPQQTQQPQETQQPKTQTRARRGEKRRLAKRRAAAT